MSAQKSQNIGDLNKLYEQADSCDKELFAEQRSNVLLISGDHWTKKTSQIYNRVRGAGQIPENQRIRLTKNHIHKVYRNYVANILSYAPGVTVLPKIEAEMQDQKDAELNKAVWEDAKAKYRLDEKIREWCGDFVGIGEVACKVFFDPNKGELKGYEAKTMEDERGNPVTDESGQPQLEMDQNGQPVPDETKPVFKGEFVFERLFGFNLLRAPGAKSMSDSPYLIVRKMVNVDDLKAQYANDPEKSKSIQEHKDDTYVVFDSNKGEYAQAKNQTMIREYYYKPCYKYPKGYFYISTSEAILEEGEIPYGLYPIIFGAFDEYPTAARGRSIVKQIRPMQAEINRSASQMAQHHITLGDDKLIYQGGTKLSPGSLLPGVRGITFNGMIPPTILPGRDGSQFLPYVQAQTEELYDVAELSEENQPAAQQVDAYSMLFASMRRLKKFSFYGEKFEQFLIDICELYLNLCRYYLPDDELIYAVGRAEQVNIPEFRKTTKLCYEIKIEPRNETLETQMGKQLTFNHILQYVGPNLSKDDIGKMIRNMPFGNSDEAFDDLTIDYDTVKNDFLAIERGETPTINEYDNHQYMVKMASARMKKPDFKFLPPPIRVQYVVYLKSHEKLVQQQAQALIDAKNEFIPVGGAMIAADMYVPNPEDPSKAAKRIRIPYQAMQWLIDHLQSQGMPLEKLETMNQGTVADMVANQPQQSRPMAGSTPTPPQGMPQQAPSGQGSASVLGVS